MSAYQVIFFLFLIILAQAIWIRFLRKKNGKLKKQANNYFYDDSDYYFDNGRRYFDPTSKDTFYVQKTLNFDYVDAEGERTHRTVDVKMVDRAPNDTYLRTMCHLRGEPRIFKTSRISNCVDIETGEIINSKNLSDFLYSEYKKSPEYSIQCLQTDFSDILKILFFLGKADGRLVKAEREIIRRVCKKDLLKDSRVSDKEIDKVINRLDIPTMQTFKRAVGRVAESELDIDLISISKEFLLTGKKQHQNETEAHQFIVKKLSNRTNKKELPDKKIIINSKEYELDFVMNRFGIIKSGDKYIVGNNEFKSMKEALIYAAPKNN